MKIVFGTEALRRECNNLESLQKRHGAKRARLVRQRLDELFNAEVLEDIRSLPHLVVRESTQGGESLALDVGHPLLLVFRPFSEPGKEPRRGNSKTAANVDSRDWKKIDSILILGLHDGDKKRNP